MQSTHTKGQEMMQETEVPAEIVHLDFEPEDETTSVTEDAPESGKSCRMPVARHSVTKAVIYCNAEAHFKLEWSATCGCEKIVAHACSDCWGFYSSGKLRVCCGQHKANLLVSQITAVIPLKK